MDAFSSGMVRAVFFVIGLLPVSFVDARLGFVLYLPLAGMALYAAVCLGRIKDQLRALIPSLRAVSPTSAAVGFFIVMAVIMSVIGYKHWPRAPNPRYSPYKLAAAEFPRLYSRMPHGAKLLIVHSPIENWDLVFLLRILYRDNDLFMTIMNGPEAQRIPLERLGHYDHIFTFEDGHYVELDNTDAIRSVEQNLRKVDHPSVALGEAVTIGKPGALQYLVKGVQVGPPDQPGYWTLDQPELRFRLSSTEHHWFNGALLSAARYLAEDRSASRWTSMSTATCSTSRYSLRTATCCISTTCRRAGSKRMASPPCGCTSTIRTSRRPMATGSGCCCWPPRLIRR